MAPSRTVGPGPATLVLGAGFVLVAATVELRGGVAGETRALVELHDLVGGADRPSLAVIDRLTDLPWLTAAAAAVLAGLLLAGRGRAAVAFMVSVGGVWLLNPVLKNLFERPRPDLWAGSALVSEFSFPSGHAANTAALFAAAVVAVPAWRWRLGAALVGLAALVLVAVSQLALGVHYPSDILAGWLWAGTWVAGVSAASRRRRSRQTRRVDAEG